MEININKTIVTDNFNNIDFDNLQIGQQILLLQQKTFYNKDNERSIYNDVTSYFLRRKIVPEIYCFDKILFNLNVDDSYYNWQMESEKVEEEEYYISIKNDIFKIENVDTFDYSSNKPITEKLKELNEQYLFNSFVIRDYIEVHDDIDKSKQSVNTIVEYYATINFEYSTLGIYIKYIICEDRYKFSSQPMFYIFKKDLEEHSKIQIDTKNISQLINIITKNFSSIYYENCINHLKLLNISVKDMREEYDNKLVFINTFKDVYMNQNIYSLANKLIEPILVDEKNKLKAYFKYSHFDCPVDVDIEYEEYKYNDYQLNTFTNKARTLSMFLTKTSIINVFTGEILNNIYSKSYEDYQYYCIKNKDTGYETIYEKIDDMYVLLDWITKDKARDNINDRIKICNTLVQ